MHYEWRRMSLPKMSDVLSKGMSLNERKGLRASCQRTRAHEERRHFAPEFVKGQCNKLS